MKQEIILDHKDRRVQQVQSEDSNNLHFTQMEELHRPAQLHPPPSSHLSSLNYSRNKDNTPIHRHGDNLSSKSHRWQMVKTRGGENDSASDTGNSNDGEGSNSNSGTSGGYQADDSYSSSDSYGLAGTPARRESKILAPNLTNDRGVPQLKNSNDLTQQSKVGTAASRHGQESNLVAKAAVLSLNTDACDHLKENRVATPETLKRRRRVKIDTKPISFPVNCTNTTDWQDTPSNENVCASNDDAIQRAAQHDNRGETEGSDHRRRRCSSLSPDDAKMSEKKDEETNEGLASSHGGNDSGGSGSGGTGNSASGGSSSTVSLDVYINLLQACRPFFNDVYGPQAEQAFINSLKHPEMMSLPAYDPSASFLTMGMTDYGGSSALPVDPNIDPASSWTANLDQGLGTSHKESTKEKISWAAEPVSSAGLRVGQNLSNSMLDGSVSPIASSKQKVSDPAFVMPKNKRESRTEQGEAHKVCSVTQTNQEREHSHQIIQQHRQHQAQNGGSSSETSKWGGSSSSLGEGKVNLAMLDKNVDRSLGVPGADGKVTVTAPTNKESNFTSTDSSSSNSGNKSQGLTMGGISNAQQESKMGRKSRGSAQRSSSQESQITSMAHGVTASSSNGPSKNDSNSIEIATIQSHAPNTCEINKTRPSVKEQCNSNVSSLSSSQQNSDDELLFPDNETIRTELAVRSNKKSRPTDTDLDKNNNSLVGTDSIVNIDKDNDSNRAIRKPKSGHSMAGSSRRSQKTEGASLAKSCATLPGTKIMLEPGAAVSLADVMTFSNVAR